MLKSIVNKYLKAFLGEIFLNAPSAHLSIAADLFSDSNLRLDDLTFRPDIFDINLQPFRLISGHLGTLSIEGITELALAGKVKFTAENIFLLFRVDTTSDAEHIQTLKKIRLEMQSGELTGSIFKELLKRIQGFPADKEADVGKRRKVVFKALDTVFKGLSFVLKNIHIRFEIHDPVNSASIPQFLSMGIIIPTIRFMPSSAAAVGTGSVAGARNMSQAQSQNLGDTILLAVRGFHCYCDYGRDSYTINGSDDASIAKEFMNRWKVEKHNLVVHPAELEISISLSMKRKSGLLLPKITVKSPEMRFSIDEKQLHTFRDISEAVVFAHKRFQQLLRVQKIFRNGFPLPRVFEVGGVRILPHLLVRNNPYPAEYRLSDETMKAGKQKASSTSTLVTFMRERVGDRWAKMMWLHVGRLVIHDLRLQRPFGRWVEIAKLASIRRKYCFIYSKLLKMSKETGNFVFDVQSNVRAETLRLLFEYEMQLPVRTILLFRSLGIMVAHVEHFNFKRKQQHAKSTAASANRASISMQSFERTSISWTDILRIFIEYNEAKRETAFHRFDRKNFEDDTLNGAYYDDASTSKASDDGSVYSYSLQTRAPVAQTISNVFSPPDKVLSKPSAAASTFSAQHHSTSSPQPIASTFRSSVKTVSSMQSSALKIFGSIGVIGGESKSVYHSHNSNEGDIKISSKFDLSVFSDFFSSLTEPEEKFVEIPTEKKVTEGGAVNAPVKDFTKMVLNDYNLGGKSPALSVIVEAVQWALLRNQQSVVLMPPDMNVNFDKISGELRSSYLPPPAVREKIASAFMTSVSFNVTVSQSSHQSKGKGSSESPIKSLRGFASLSGALLQFRLVSKQLSVSVYADRAVAEAVAKDHAAVIAQYESLIAGKSSGKGTMLSTGLPAYPASQNKSSSEKSQSSSSGRASVKKQGNDKESLDGTEESLVEDAANEIEEINRAIFTPNAARTTEISGVKVQPGKTIFQSVKDMESVDGDGDMSLHCRSESQLSLLNMKGDECGSMDGATDEELLLMLEYQNGKLFGPSADAKMHPVGDADAPKNIHSGTTVLDSSNMMKKIVQSKPKKDIVPESSVDARIAEKEDKESSPANADKAATGLVEKVFVFSVPEENFLVFCVILDLDDKGEGAADVQLQLGGLKGDLSRVTLSAIAHPLLLSTSHNALKSLQQLRKLRPLLPSLFADGSDNSRKERALIIDRALRIPLVSLYFHASTSRNRKKIAKTAIGTAVESGSPKEAHASSLTFSPTHNDEDYISSDGDTLNGDDESELEGESVDLPQNVQNLLQEVREDGLHAQHVQIRKRQAALYNKNIHQWAGLLDSFLPRVVSVCVRMSPASIECVESSVIRDFIFSKIHDVVNRASQRLSSASQRADSHMLSGALQLLSTLFMRQKLGDNKASIRRWGSKRQHAQNMREDLLFVVSSSSQKNSSSPASQQEQRPLSLARSLVSIPSFDLILTKAAVPYPAVDIHMLGLQLKLPVTDETLCHLLALLLGHVFPFYY